MMAASMHVGKVGTLVVRQADWPADRLLGWHAGWEAGRQVSGKLPNRQAYKRTVS